MISIDCTAVENELDASMLQRGELDWLIYNKPLEYADLILNGGIEDYIKRNAGASVNRLKSIRTTLLLQKNQ